MTNQTKQTNLRLVQAPRREPINQKEFLEPGPQNGLFPSFKPGLLIFVFFPDVTEQEFRDTLEYSQPGWVMELRRAPRFDLGRLNRRGAFEIFTRHHSTYVDLTSTTMGQFDDEDIISTVSDFLKVKKPNFERPIVFLLERDESARPLTDRILELVKPKTLEVCEIPKFINDVGDFGS